MKKIYNMIIACLGILLLFACEADKEGMGGVGYLRLGVVESNDVITKAEETYDAEVFTVTITNKTSGEVAKTIEAWAKGEKQEIALEPGTYTISATSAGYDSKAAFDKPYYAGQEEIQITAGNAVEKTVTCTLANVRVSVVFDEALLEKYADRTITVSVDGGAGNSLNFGRDEAGRDKQAYFPVADLTAKISISKPQGASDATPYEYSYTIDDVKAKHWYILTYRLPDTGDGDFTVTYDPTMKTYNYDFVVNPVAKNTASLTANAWAKFAYLTATDITTENDKVDISSLKFQYKKKADNAWTDAETAESEGTYTATVKGLDANTAYDYRLANADETFVSNDEFTTEAATVLPNASFDDWYQNQKARYAIREADATSFDNHKGYLNSFWDSGNMGAAMMSKNPTEQETSDVKSGSAARLKSQFVGVLGVGKFAAGNIYTGHYYETIMSPMGAKIFFGQPFTSRPTQLKGWYKYNRGTSIDRGDNPYKSELEATGGDLCSIYIALADNVGLDGGGQNYAFQIDNTLDKDDSEHFKYKNTIDFSESNPNIVAYGTITDEEAKGTGEWQEFTIDLKYRDLTRVPKYIIVVASASKYGDFFTGSESSVMYLDDFSLVYDGEPTVKE